MRASSARPTVSHFTGTYPGLQRPLTAQPPALLTVSCPVYVKSIQSCIRRTSLWIFPSELRFLISEIVFTYERIIAGLVFRLTSHEKTRFSHFSGAVFRFLSPRENSHRLSPTDRLKGLPCSAMGPSFPLIYLPRHLCPFVGRPQFHGHEVPSRSQPQRSPSAIRSARLVPGCRLVERDDTWAGRRPPVESSAQVVR